MGLASAHRELLERLEAAASFEGFVASLLDIRDGMLFYDRDLMLAGYAGTLEGLIVSALAAACLHDDEAAERAFAAVRRVVDEFPQRLAQKEAPADVQAVAEAFVRGACPMLRDRVSAYLAAFSRYVHGDYDLGASLDALVGAGQALAEREPQAALDRLGEAGALMLRGRPLRARWDDLLEGRARLWVDALRHMVAHLASTAPSFPWEAVEVERRRCPPGRAVVELEAFRRRRSALLAGWPRQTAIPPDPVDMLVERVFAGPQALDPPTVDALERAAEEALPVLAGIVRARHLLRGPAAHPQAVAAAVRALAYLRRHEAAGELVDLAASPAVPGEVRAEARAALEQMGPLAVDGLRAYLQRTPELDGGSALVDLVARLPRSDQTFRALVEIFRRLRWEDDGKMVALAALADYGDSRAAQVLRQALEDPRLPPGAARRVLESAVRRLTSGRRRRAPRSRRAAR